MRRSRQQHHFQASNSNQRQSTRRLRH
uniref:Uncharacterized protein n=1 Tax=Arundo donax TaxID=35708 RepID=A0A0A9AYN6_ARUDO